MTLPHRLTLELPGLALNAAFCRWQLPGWQFLPKPSGDFYPVQPGYAASKTRALPPPQRAARATPPATISSPPGRRGLFKGFDMKARFIVACTKTGDWLEATSEAHARAIAARKGWVDYTIEAVR